MYARSVTDILYRRMNLAPVFPVEPTSTQVQLYSGKEYGLVLPMTNPEEFNSIIYILFQAST